MKILLVLHHNLRFAGGVASRVRFVSELLKQRGHKVGIAYPSASSGKPILKKENNMYVIQHQYYERNIPVIEQLDNEWQKILNEGWDVVHYHHIKNLSLSFWQLTKGIKQIYTLHDYYLYCPRVLRLTPKGNECPHNCRKCYSEKFPMPISLISSVFPTASVYSHWRETVMKFAQYIDAFIAPSNYIKRIFDCFDNTIYLPFNCENKKKKLKTSDKFNVVFMGGNAFHKGFSILARAIDMIDDNNIIFSLYGRYSTSDRKKYKEYIKGYYREEEKENVWNNTDLLVVPSLWEENAPYVIYEARSYNIPVIGTNIGGIPELIPKENLFEKGNYKALKDLILKSKEGKVKSVNCSRLPNNEQFYESLMEMYL